MLLNPSAAALLIRWRNQLRMFSIRLWIIFATFWIGWSPQPLAHEYHSSKNTSASTAIQQHHAQVRRAHIHGRSETFHQGFAFEPSHLLLSFLEPILTDLPGDATDPFGRQIHVRQHLECIAGLRETPQIRSRPDDLLQDRRRDALTRRTRNLTRHREARAARRRSGGRSRGPR